MLGLVSGKYLHHIIHSFNLKRYADFRANKPSDVISTLVSIYDSKDLFVKELQVLLAQRLLAVKDGNFEKEVWHSLPFCLSTTNVLLSCNFQRRNIEILKIRFGEAALQVCEVMLRDMTDSKRIDQHVQSQHAVRSPFAWRAPRESY
jgi:anaphase-promoting complex subunit 2